MWVPHKLKKNKLNKKKRRCSSQRVEQPKEFFIFFSLFSLSSLFDIRKSDRQNSSRQEAKCSTQQGLRMGTKNTGFHRVFN